MNDSPKPRSPFPQTPLAANSPLRGPSDALGSAHLGATLALTAGGVVAAAQSGWLPWAAGQVFLAVASLRWFLILHEAGHQTLFASRGANRLSGALAGALSGIPARSWRRVHAAHHRWTGWQDRDPTTAGLAGPVPRGPLRWLLEVCWRLRLPLIAILYRRPYWGLGQSAAGSQRRPLGLRETFPTWSARLEALAVLSLPLLTCATAFLALGAAWTLSHFAPGVLLGLVFQERLILSQHTHLPQRRAEERAVRPFSAKAQGAFTRSLVGPAWLSWLLLGAESHSLHHRFPHVPGYRLRTLGLPVEHAPRWTRWLTISRAHSAAAYLFCDHRACERCTAAALPSDPPSTLPRTT